MAGKGRATKPKPARPKPAKPKPTEPKPAGKPPHWFHAIGGWGRTGVVVGGIALLVGWHFVLWGTVIPAVGEVVGRVPVVSTVVGWLFVGGAFAALGVLAVNHDTARPKTLKWLKVVGWTWGAAAVAGVPSRYANGIVLPTDYWAGVYSGAYGLAWSPLTLLLAVGLSALIGKWVNGKAEPTTPIFGWVLVGYSFLLLVWGSSLLRV